MPERCKNCGTELKEDLDGLICPVCTLRERNNELEKRIDSLISKYKKEITELIQGYKMEYNDPNWSDGLWETDDRYIDLKKIISELEEIRKNGE